MVNLAACLGEMAAYRVLHLAMGSMAAENFAQAKERRTELEVQNRDHVHLAVQRSFDSGYSYRPAWIVKTVDARASA